MSTLKEQAKRLGLLATDEELDSVRSFLMQLQTSDLTASKIAASFANTFHRGRLRGGGRPSVGHPLAVAARLWHMGQRDDTIICLALLHDAIEDGYTDEGGLLSKGIPANAVHGITLLTKATPCDDKEFLAGIFADGQALLVKLADCEHNLSALAEEVSADKMREYVRETEERILPLCPFGQELHTKLRRKIGELWFGIASRCRLVDLCIAAYERGQTDEA